MGLVKKLGKAIVPFALAGSMLLGGCDSQPPQPQRLEQRISQEVAQPNGQPDKYGVIISGNTDYRHKENLSLAYQVLLENGFQRENIYILDSDGEKTAFYPVDDLASKEAIKILFGHLSKKVDSKDLLFVYTTDHGERITKTDSVNGKETPTELSTLVIPGEDLSETEMATYLSSIHPKTGVLVFDQCYSGGFAQRTGTGNYIGISASEADKVSKANTFPQALFNSWRDKKADENKDGRISIQEAFDYALANDSYAQSKAQTPQIFSGINADEVFLK